jgi:hypothetical protein
LSVPGLGLHRQALFDDEPRLMHFAGHGGVPDVSIAVEDDYGLARVIPVDGLVHLFSAFGRSVDCVLANAFGTELLARELSVVVPYAIGMRPPVRDKSSIRFSAGFYQGLAAGKSIEEAFQLGVIMLEMMPIGSDAGAPVLFRRDLPSEACSWTTQESPMRLDTGSRLPSICASRSGRARLRVTTANSYPRQPRCL